MIVWILLDSLFIIYKDVWKFGEESFEYRHIWTVTFDLLLERLKDNLSRKENNLRKLLSAEVRLVETYTLCWIYPKINTGLSPLRTLLVLRNCLSIFTFHFINHIEDTVATAVSHVFLLEIKFGYIKWAGRRVEFSISASSWIIISWNFKRRRILLKNIGVWK